jgi:hypothetical protein
MTIAPRLRVSFRTHRLQILLAPRDGLEPPTNGLLIRTAELRGGRYRQIVEPPCRIFLSTGRRNGLRAVCNARRTQIAITRPVGAYQEGLMTTRDLANRVPGLTGTARLQVSRAKNARNDLHPHFLRSIVGPRETGFGISGRRGVAGVATVQLNVVWQAAQSSEVTACWACLPVAVTPLWQLRQVALIPK